MNEQESMINKDVHSSFILTFPPLSIVIQCAFPNTNLLYLISKHNQVDTSIKSTTTATCISHAVLESTRATRAARVLLPCVPPHTVYRVHSAHA